MADIFSSLVTPETALLQAQAAAIDENLADYERLAGAATQESRNDLRRRRQGVIRMMGRYGGTSNDINEILTGIETQQKGEEDVTSQELIERKGAAGRMKAQIAQIIPIRRTQEIYGAVKDVAGVGLQAAGMLTGGVGGAALTAGGAMLGGRDVGESLDARDYMRDDMSDWRDRMKTRRGSSPTDNLGRGDSSDSGSRRRASME